VKKDGIFRIVHKRNSVFYSWRHFRIVKHRIGSVSRTYELRIACRTFVWKLTGMESLRIPNKRCKCQFKMDHRKVGFEGGSSVELAYDHVE